MDSEFKTRYINARKNIIASCFAGLNQAQLEAVMTTQGPLLLLAGAGSGKTTVVINRIANLLRFGRGSDSDELPQGVGQAELELLESYVKNPRPELRDRVEELCALDPCPPWRVIAITFTNKAADEMKSRLETMLGSQATDVWARTFHSACVRILRRDADRLGFSNSFTIYDMNDSVSLMKRVLRELDMDEKVYPPKSLLGYIGKAKDLSDTPESFIARARATGDIRREKTGEAWKLYEERKKSADAMDFDDLLYYTAQLLEEHPQVRDYYQNYFRYVLIDEYQDTNNLQYRIAAALAGERANICVVGDDDQSIYKFRGATIENILSFERRYKGARVIRLERNYRSTGNILDAANAVIRNNTQRKGKELWTDRGRGDKLTLYVAQNENDEAAYVASEIMNNFSGGGSWGDNVVLYRMNAQSNKLEYAFKRAGIPYRVVGGMKFFERAEIKDILAYLCLIQNPDDDVRLMRIINVPARAIGAKTVEAVAAIAHREGKPMFTVIRDSESYPELGRTAAKLRLFAKMILEMRQAEERLPLDELFDFVLHRSGYETALKEKAGEEERSRLENLGELKTNILSYMENVPEPGLAGFLDEVALYTDIDALDGASDSVTMMTMHTAKGLEFENVYIVGVEEGIFPGVRCIGEPEEMEEERRLCYVGMTRAKKKLTLCSARQRMLFGRTSMNLPSRFVGEIPPECIERIGVPETSSFAGDRDAGFSGSRGSFSGGFTERKSPSRSVSWSKTPPGSGVSSSKPAAPSFKTGDKVEHRAFGSGEIIKMTPMGGDHLIEVQFGDTVKKLMLRAAAPNMKKI